MRFIFRSTVILLTIATVLLQNLALSPQASATVSPPSSSYALTGSARTIGQSSMISGYTGNVRVVVSSSNTDGLLSLSTVSNLKEIPGYDNSASITTAGDRIAFEATVADANAALETLQYQGSAVQTDTITLNVESAGFSSRVVTEDCDGNGSVETCYHYYKAINSTLTWPQAYTETTTQNQTVGSTSQAGWLVTITTEAEKSFVNSYVNVDSWIGAHDSDTYGASEGNWKWVSNSEPGVAGKTFWIGTSSGSLQTGFYQNWASGEPNNALHNGTYENFGQAYAAGGWNDLPGSFTQNAYIWETTSTTNLLGSEQVSFSVSVYSGPANTVPPVVSGSGMFSEVLTTDDGEWSDNGQSISATSYQWQRNTGAGWSDISNATSAAYTLTASDVGAKIRSVVSKTNSAGTSSAFSTATAEILPMAPGDPTLSSVTSGNGQLTVAFNAPSSDGGGEITGYEYSLDAGKTWVSNTNISSSPFIISGLVNGTAYSISLRAINAGGSGLPSSTISGTPFSSPINTAIPALVGTPRIGDEVTLSKGTWSTNGSPFTVSSQQWQRNTGSGWSDIVGQTGEKYTVSSADLGAQLRVAVIRTNAAGTTIAHSSASSPIIITAPDAPTLSNLIIGNNRLSFTANPGSVDGGAPVTLEYSLDGTTWIALVPNQLNTYTVAGLTGGTPYVIQLRSTNSAGSTLASSTLSGTPAIPPANVAIPSANSSSNQSVIPGIPLIPEIEVVRRQLVISYGTPLSPELKARISSPVALTVSPGSSLSSNSGFSREIALDNDGRPMLNPLQSLALIDGKPIEVSLMPNAQRDGYILSAKGFSVAVSGKGNSATSYRSLLLSMGKKVTLDISGFAPGQPIYLWLFSEPTPMGFVTADHNGTFTGSITVPEGLETGSHTMQINGVSKFGEVYSVAVGVTLDNPSAQETTSVNTNAATGIAPWIWVIFGIVFILLLLTVALLRHRRTQANL